MASVEKQLLGTETVQRMRARGVTSRICGLSANDMQSAFLEAGANAFLQKPLPCKPDALSRALRHVWFSADNEDTVTAATPPPPSPVASNVAAAALPPHPGKTLMPPGTDDTEETEEGLLSTSTPLSDMGPADESGEMDILSERISL